MFSLIAWITLSVLMGLLTLWAVWSRYPTKWRTLSLILFIINIFLGGGAIGISQGWASSCSLLLPGKYNMIGFLAKPQEAIYLFLDTQYGPKTCYIPWDTKNADDLQKNQEKNGSDFEIKWGDDGKGGYNIPGFSEGGEIEERPATPHDQKPAEVI